MRLLLTKTSDSKTCWMIYSWTCLPSPSATTMAHAFKTPTKVTLSSATPSFCNCWNKSNALSALVHTSHVPRSWQSRRPHCVKASCWTHSVHHSFSHIWHTCQWGNFSQRHLTQNHFKWSVHEHVYPLQAPLDWHMHSALPQNWQGLVSDYLLHLLKNFQCLVALPTFHMSKYHSSPRDHSQWGHLLEHSPSIIHAATFGIHVNKAIFPQRHHAQSQPESPPVHECTLPTSNAHRLAHALRTGTKVNLSGVMPSCCICWKSCMVFSGCRALTLSLELFIHEKMFNCNVPGAIAASFTATHGGFCGSSSQSACCVILCLKLGKFTLTRHEKFKSSCDQAHVLNSL